MTSGATAIGGNKTGTQVSEKGKKWHVSLEQNYTVNKNIKEIRVYHKV